MNQAAPRIINRRLPRLLAVACVLVSVPVLGVIPRFWEVRTYDEFRAGDLEGLSITGDGRLVLAPNFDLVFDTGEPLIFSAVVASDGRIYLGTGHEGKVFAVDPDGNGDLLVDLGELDVFSMALDSDDTLFVATSPGGAVYRVGAGGEAEIFFDPDDLYIWSMAFDDRGRLLVATGDDGIIYRVDAEGAGEILYDSEETHIMTLAAGAAGAILAGGDPKGYVYRISETGQPFVLHDSDLREVHSVAVGDDGTVFAVVVNAEGATGSGGSAATPTSGPVRIGGSSVVVANSTPVPQAVVPASADEAPVSGSASNIGAPNATSSSAILEIRPDGSVATLWVSSGEMIFSVLPFGDRLLFSTGTRGRIYEYEGPGRATLLAESTEEQTTLLLASGDRVLAATSNTGNLFELTDRVADAGVYTSVVRDTSAVSTWGKLTWSGAGVEILTRTGNTGSPDGTWSDWEPVGDGGEVSSPPARFIQWRALLEGGSVDDSELSAVTLPYLQQNFRPEVRSVDVLRPGVALREAQTTAGVVNGSNNNNRGGLSGRVMPLSPPQQPRTVLEPGVQALRWAAEDANQDSLTYSILYRAGNENDWKSLASGLRDTFYTISPNTLPDGMYVMRVVASDIASNPEGSALTGEFQTRPFSIDNSPPVVEVQQQGIEGGRVRLIVAAQDGTSILKQAEVSVDAGPWTPVFPLDGIVDSTAESFDFVSMPLGPGEHVISVRIYDQSDNVGIGAAIVVVP